jgi:hypothetical protein
MGKNDRIVEPALQGGENTRPVATDEGGVVDGV